MADKDEEIHLHGFDRKWALKAGQSMAQTFAADRTGSFEIEIEDTSTHLMMTLYGRNRWLARGELFSRTCPS